MELKVDRRLMEVIAEKEDLEAKNIKLKNLLRLIFEDECAKVMDTDLYSKLKEELNVNTID